MRASLGLAVGLGAQGLSREYDIVIDQEVVRRNALARQVEPLPPRKGCHEDRVTLSLAAP